MAKAKAGLRVRSIHAVNPATQFFTAPLGGLLELANQLLVRVV